jgi:hypothetical protein
MPVVSIGRRNSSWVRVAKGVVTVGRALKLPPAEVDEVWVRWHSGQAVNVVARETRVSPSTVRDLLRRTGGIRPAPKRRWELRLSLAEREEISRGLAAGVVATGDRHRSGSGAVDGEP